MCSRQDIFGMGSNDREFRIALNSLQGLKAFQPMQKR
jgi:hypothetical protein